MKIRGMGLNEFIGKKIQFQYSLYDEDIEEYVWMNLEGYVISVSVKARYEGKEEYDFSRPVVKFDISTSKNPFRGRLYKDVDITRIGRTVI